MFRLMRNVHLWLGLVFVLMSMIFAVSSLVIIYRKSLAIEPEKTERTLALSAEAAASPRLAAREVMASADLPGELRQVQETPEQVSFMIYRPGETARVTYPPSGGEAKLEISRYGALETMVRLHTNHGMWHEDLPTGVWAIINFLASAGLLLLGASGIYLWWVGKADRVMGSILVGFSLVFGLACLIHTRLQQ